MLHSFPPSARTRALLLVPLLALAGVAACAGADEMMGAAPTNTKSTSSTQGAPTGLPCEVDAILQSRCQTCHATEPKAGASISLVTWADLQKAGPGAHADKKVYELAHERIADVDNPMPPKPRSMLAERERATLDAWFSQGAPRVDVSCTTNGPAVPVTHVPCNGEVLSIKPSKPYTVKPDSPRDDYECFGVDVDLTKKRHVVSFAPLIDNTRIVHHLLLYQVGSSVPSEPFPCNAQAAFSWKLIAGWAPGAGDLVLPPEAGFPEEVGSTHWALQVHYSLTNTPTGTDQSSYELCTTEDLRPNDAGMIAFGSNTFTIPPRSKHTIACDYKLGNQFKNVTLFNAQPHMHSRGAAMSTQRFPGGVGEPEVLFEQDNYSFEAQFNTPMLKSITTDDLLRTRCTWKNPTDREITFGEKSDDEMCLNFFSYYPNIPDVLIHGTPGFTWITPATTSECVVEDEAEQVGHGHQTLEGRTPK